MQSVITNAWFILFSIILFIGILAFYKLVLKPHFNEKEKEIEKSEMEALATHAEADARIAGQQNHRQFTRPRTVVEMAEEILNKKAPYPYDDMR